MVYRGKEKPQPFKAKAIDRLQASNHVVWCVAGMWDGESEFWKDLFGKNFNIPGDNRIWKPQSKIFDAVKECLLCFFFKKMWIMVKDKVWKTPKLQNTSKLKEDNDLWNVTVYVHSPISQPTNPSLASDESSCIIESCTKTPWYRQSLFFECPLSCLILSPWMMQYNLLPDQIKPAHEQSQHSSAFHHIFHFINRSSKDGIQNSIPIAFPTILL